MTARVGIVLYALLLSSGCSKPAPSAPPLPPIPEGYLRVPMGAKEINLDPAGTWIATNTEVYNILFDSLYWIGADGGIEPNLAAVMPEISEDGLRYRIPIRQDARFHDDRCFPEGKGRKVRAEDVVYSLKRIAHPGNSSGLFALLRGYIVGLDEYRSAVKSGKIGADAPVAGLTAVDDSTVELRLLHPVTQLPQILGCPHFGVVPKEAVKRYGKRFASHPVGTGPFRLESYHAEQILLRAVPGHRRFPAGSSGNAPRGIAFRFYESQDQDWQAFQSGSFHVLELSPRRLYAFVDSTLAIKPALRGAGYRLDRFSSPNVEMLIFNYRVAAFRDVRVRRAIAWCVPWERMAARHETVSASILPRGIAGHRARTITRDLAKAKAELARAGFPNGKGLPELRIRAEYSGFLPLAAVVADALAELGIRARIDRGNTVIEGADLSLISWVLDYPDGANILSIFDSRSLPPHGYNHGGHKDAEFDALLDRMSRERGEKRRRIVERAEEMFWERVIAIPYLQADDFVAVGPDVEGVSFDWSGSIQWSRVRFRGKKSP